MRKSFYLNRGKHLGSALLLAGGLLLASKANAQVDAYNFTPSAGTYTPLTGGTTVSAIQADDVLSGTLPLGFAFVFDGTSYTDFKVSSNGWLTFNTAASGSSLTNDLDNGTANERPRVAPYWDDLDGRGSNAAASYATTGTAPNRVFTFEWLNWFRFSNPNSVFSMQVQLFEGTNQVRFVYQLGNSTPLTAATASVGLSGISTTGGCSSFLSLNNVSAAPVASGTTETDNIPGLPASGQVYTFVPPVPSSCPIPRCLAATVNNTTATVTYTTSNTPSGPFTIIYGPTGFNPATGGTTLTGVTGTTTTITGLAPGNYQFFVRQECGGTLGSSTLSGAGNFVVDCPSAGGLTVNTTTNTTASLSWAGPLPVGATYTVIYGPNGFDPVTGGTRVTGITTNGTTLTNLTPDTNYQFYVIISCLGGGTGPLTGPVAFATLLTEPDNNEPCGALPLPSGAPVNGTTIGATTSLQNGIVLPACAPAAAPADVWFVFNLAAGATSTTLNLTGTAAGMVRLFTAPNCTGGPFVQVGCQAATTNNVGFTAPVTFSGLTAGQRYWVAVSGFGSSDITGGFTIAASNAVLGTRPSAAASELQVYPNPSGTGELTLRVAGTAGAGEATLLNTLGQTVRRVRVAAGTSEQRVSTRGLAAGVYTLRLTVGQQASAIKVVLQ